MPGQQILLCVAVILLSLPRGCIPLRPDSYYSTAFHTQWLPRVREARLSVIGSQSLAVQRIPTERSMLAQRHIIARGERKGGSIQPAFMSLQGTTNAAVRQRALNATERWLEDWVIGLRLCPWAAGSQRAPLMRLLASDGGEEEIEEHVAWVCREVQELKQRRSELNGFATTLLVFTHLDFQGQSATPHAPASCGAFPRLWSACCEALQEAGEAVDLLAFHKSRVDVGPGCSADPGDAAHYSVRSPYPTLQLLLQEDLEAARAAWANGEVGGSREGRRGPGAFGLLQQNKRRLRRMGASELAQQLAALDEEAERASEDGGDSNSN